MPAKYKYTNEADIPQEFKTLYILKDGVWMANIEGAADAAQFGEFRDNNRELMRLLGASTMPEAKTKLEALSSIDPRLYAELKAKEQQLKDGKLFEAGKIDEIVAERTKTMVAEHTRKIETLETEKKTLNTSLEENLIFGAIATAASAKGVRPGALDDVKERGRKTFKIEGGKVFAFDASGGKRYNGKGTPMEVTEWMDELATNAGHLFEPNSGGAGGGHHRGGGGNGQVKNPWSTKTHNLTEQSKIQRTNPALAKQLKESAEM